MSIGVADLPHIALSTSTKGQIGRTVTFTQHGSLPRCYDIVGFILPESMAKRMATPRLTLKCALHVAMLSKRKSKRG